MSRGRLRTFAKMTALGTLAMHLIIPVAPATCSEPADDVIVVELPNKSTGCYELPSRDKIATIEAEMYNRPGILGELPDVNPFVLPQNDYDAILEYFENPLLDRSPRSGWPEIGSLKITTRDGHVVRICCFWRLGKGPLSYSIRGFRCVDGRPSSGDFDDALTLDLRLRLAYQELTGLVATRPLPLKLETEKRDGADGRPDD